MFSASIGHKYEGNYFSLDLTMTKEEVVASYYRKGIHYTRVAFHAVNAKTFAILDGDTGQHAPNPAPAGQIEGDVDNAVNFRHGETEAEHIVGCIGCVCCCCTGSVSWLPYCIMQCVKTSQRHDELAKKE